MNISILIGRLTKAPEMRYTQSGIPVCSFTLAVDRNYKDANGERGTDFIDIVVWRQLGENCSKYLSKGKMVAVAGRIQVQTYEAKDGSNRKSFSVVAEEVKFLSPRESAGPAASMPEPEAPPFGPSYDDGDGPF